MQQTKNKCEVMGCCVSGEKDGREAEPLARPKYSW